MSQPVPPTVPPLTDAQKTPEHLALVADIWKHSVNVQMHFNDMGMKIRNLYFTILAAAIGLVGVVQGHKVEVPYPPLSIHLSLFVILAVIPISMLFYFLDKHWYHRLLMGSVKHCGAIEDRYKDVLPELQLGTSISRESPVKFDGYWRGLFWFIRDKRFRDKTKSNIHSDAKLEVLYKSVIWGALALALAYGLFWGVDYNHCSLPALASGAECPDP